MAIQAGDKMPAGVFGLMTETGPGAISTDDLFSGKKVVLFSVPGAFTPPCSNNNLPHAWGKDRGVDDKVMMLADGNGDYVKALGLELDATGFGMGLRGERFAIVVDDGVATHVAVEAPGQFEVSSAEAIIANL